MARGSSSPLKPRPPSFYHSPARKFKQRASSSLFPFARFLFAFPCSSIASYSRHLVAIRLIPVKLLVTPPACLLRFLVLAPACLLSSALPRSQCLCFYRSYDPRLTRSHLAQRSSCRDSRTTGTSTRFSFWPRLLLGSQRLEPNVVRCNEDNNRCTANALSFCSSTLALSFSAVSFLVLAFSSF